MGKTRHRRLRCAARQINPLGAVVVAEDVLLNEMAENPERFDAEDIGNNTLGPIEAIREQLQNVNIEEKVNGLQALAVLTGNPEKMEMLCGTDIVRIAAPLLCDTDVAVRNAAAGALRNFSVNGVNVCEFLVDQDILTPLLTLLNEYAKDSDWQPTFDTQMSNEMDIRSDVYLQAINLLWNLCESTPQALDQLNQSQLIRSFVRCLNFNVYGMEIAISVAQCLLVISEGNPKSWNILSDYLPNFIYLLNDGESSRSFYLRSLTAGILSNVPALAASYSTAIVQSLMEVLDESNEDALRRLVPIALIIRQRRQVPELHFEMESMDEETEEAAAKRRRRDELPTEDDLLIREVGYILDAQRMAAEIITNLCGAEEEEDCNESPRDQDDDDQDEEFVMDGDSNEDCSSGVLNGEKLPKEMCELMKCGNLTEKLWKCAQPLDEQLQKQLYEIHIHLLIKLKNLRISSLLCLQNLYNCLSCEDLGGKEVAYNVWSTLGQQVFKEPQDTMILEPSTSLMRAALEHIKTNPELFQQLTLSDIELMLNGVVNCKVTEVRANWLRMLGTLGCILNEDFVKVIISFIVEACPQEQDVWVLSEALDALMDMFADNDWPQLVKSLHLVKVLSTLEKRFKCLIRAQRKELNNRYPAVQTVRTNLTRFIKYLQRS